MSETIQRYELTGFKVPYEGGLWVKIEDHNLALAAAQAEVERLKVELSNVTTLPVNDPRILSLQAFRESLDECKGALLIQTEQKNKAESENAALKRELEEARAELRAAKEECAACTAAVEANIGEQVAEENGILRVERDQLQSRVVELEGDRERLDAAIEKLPSAVLRAYCDPGSFLPRGDNYNEPIMGWCARAVKLAVQQVLLDAARSAKG